MIEIRVNVERVVAWLNRLNGRLLRLADWLERKTNDAG